MLIKYENFINNYSKLNNYIHLLKDINNLLEVNQNNIQNLLTNNTLDFKLINYYSSKKNKLLYENLDNNHFTNFIIHILNKIYNDNEIKFNLNHNILKSINKHIFTIKNNLNTNGLYILNNAFNKKKCFLILNQLNNKLFIDRTNNIIKNINLFENNKNIWWIHNYNDLLNIKEIQYIITSEYLLKVAFDYFQCKPILHNILFWASYPGNIDTTQQFHQDFDDIKFLKIFIYLNDVNDNNGPHVYVKKSLHNINKIKDIDSKLSQRYDDEIINEKFNNDIINIKGNTGTIIFEDTHGLHKGTNVKEGQRFVLQLVYGVSTFYHLKNNNYNKYECDINKHKIIYDAFLKFPYSFMNFTFHQ